MKFLLIVLVALFCNARGQDYDYTDEVTGPSPVQEVIDYYLPAEEPGSGDAEPQPECRMSYVTYERKFLRGVKETNHISFNATTFEECRRLCCFETSFECRSFTYFEVLKQCFIMNVTQHYEKFKLDTASGHVHYELVEVATTTVPPPTTTTPPFPTPGYVERRSTTTTTKGRTDNNQGDQGGNPNGEADAITDDNNSNSNNANRINGNGSPSTNRLVCPQCSNMGKCRTRPVVDQVAKYEAYCECKKGFEGSLCEKKVSHAGSGLQPWMIALIALGGIILILFLSVCILYHAYRKKTGEYNVFKAIRKWARRGRKTRAGSSDVSEDYPMPEESTHSLHRHTSMHHPLSLHHHTSPTASVLSIHESVTSSATHSTMTSV